MFLLLLCNAHVANWDCHLPRENQSISILKVLLKTVIVWLLFLGQKRPSPYSAFKHSKIAKELNSTFELLERANSALLFTKKEPNSSFSFYKTESWQNIYCVFSCQFIVNKLNLFIMIKLYHKSEFMRINTLCKKKKNGMLLSFESFQN